MYAAAGGASIANRRKQKRLQLNKKEGGQAAAAAAAAARARSVGQHSAGKLPTGQPIPSLRLQLPPPVIQQPSYGFHSSHEHRRGGHRRAPHVQRKREQQNGGDYGRHRLLPPPVSPIVQFPISPPPLSLESPDSLLDNVAQIEKTANHGLNSAGTVAFPFPPPSFLDLRVSPANSELQCGGQGPGKAAWQGCARPSPLPLSPASPQGSRGEGYKTKQCEAHRRWMKRNRIRDASYCYGSSGEEDDYDDYEEPGSGFPPSSRRRGGEVSAAVNTVLYAGLGTTALGLVVSFVGTGEKGFLSPELRLVGPSLLCAGLLCCLLRVLLCLCLCRCCGECRWRPCHRLLRVSKPSKDSKRPSNKKSPKTTATSASSQPPGASSHPLKQPTTATSSDTRQQHHLVPSSSSGSTAKPHKPHELLLSPAQLPE